MLRQPKRSASASSRRTKSPAARRAAKRAAKPKVERDPAAVPANLDQKIGAALKAARIHNLALIHRLRREERITAGTVVLLNRRWSKKMQWLVVKPANLFPLSLHVTYKGKFANGQRTDHHLTEGEVLAEDADNVRKGIVQPLVLKADKLAARLARLARAAAAAADDDEEGEESYDEDGPGDEEGAEFMVVRGSGARAGGGDGDGGDDDEDGEYNPDDYWGEEGRGRLRVRTRRRATTWRWMGRMLWRLRRRVRPGWGIWRCESRRTLRGDCRLVVCNNTRENLAF
ncbi:hypothetical protein MMC30_004534 [Trapelia coarctata]|nr:hypothetical protein [Trapelia coarctata]